MGASDIISVTDIVKALVSPCEKLIGAIQSAISKAYEPRHIKKMADAKAYEITVVGRAMRESSDIPITYTKADLSLDTSDFCMFMKRSKKRMGYKESMEQEDTGPGADQPQQTKVGGANHNTIKITDKKGNKYRYAFYAHVLVSFIHSKEKCAERAFSFFCP